MNQGGDETGSTASEWMPESDRTAIDIDSFLIKPVQRLTKYPLLFRALLFRARGLDDTRDGPRCDGA